jgi:hypothetical protein
MYLSIFPACIFALFQGDGKPLFQGDGKHRPGTAIALSPTTTIGENMHHCTTAMLPFSYCCPLFLPIRTCEKTIDGLISTGQAFTGQTSTREVSTFMEVFIMKHIETCRDLPCGGLARGCLAPGGLAPGGLTRGCLVQCTEELLPLEAEQHAPLNYLPRVVRLRATIEGLDTSCIPFAVLKEEPRLAFESVSYESWQKLFTSQRPDQIFFLVAWSSFAKTSSRLVQAAAFTIGIATSGPLQKRWLTTFAVKRQGEFVAWCEEIDMSDDGIGQGLILEIVLSQKNMLYLGKADET